MTRPVTMDSNARVRRRSRKRYESCDHNFDTIIQNKYESRRTALDQNYASILRETRDHQRRKGESSNVKKSVHSGACPTETLSSESTKVKTEGGYRRRSLGSALSSSRKSHLEDDHNFDRLSQSFGSGNKVMELRNQEDSKSVEKCDKNNYWKQYEEKYGKLGITVNDNEGHSTKTKSLENVNSPRENNLSRSSLSYCCNGVIGRHSFGKTDPDEGTTDKSGEKSVHNSELRVKGSGNSPENPESSVRRTRTSFGAKDSDDEKSLENLSSKPPRGQSGRRRAASDLGFTDTNCQTPRTSALLRQPSFRKHLAKVMHVKDKPGEVQDSLTLELAFRLASTTNLLKLKNSSEEEVDKLGHDWSLDTDSKLRVSTSEYNIRCKSAETSPRNSEIFDWENYKINESNDSEEEPILMKSFLRPQCKQSSDLENKSEVHGYSKRSKFHIPSFSEFRKLRSKSGLLPDKVVLHKRERAITEENERDIEQKCDLERSMSFSQNVQEKHQNPRQLRRTNTDPSIVVPDQEKGTESGGCRDESAEAEHDRSKQRKDRSRRKLEVTDSHQEVKGRSRGHTVPQVSAASKLPTNEKVQSSKHTRPKNNHDENNFLVEPGVNVLRKLSDSSENEQSFFRELDCWKQSVFDSEKGSDSDNGSSFGEQRMKRKRRSLRKAKTNDQRVQSDGKIETPYTDVRILNSDHNKKIYAGSGNEAKDSGSNSGREPTGLPPMAPKKLRRRSDGKSPRRRHRSIPEDEEAVSSDYLSSSGNFTSSTSDVQIDIENDTDDALKVTSNNDLTCVMRSTSDVSEMIHEIARKRDNKEKRSKPYKSDPFGSSGRRRNLREATLMKESDQKRRIKGGSSEEEVITFLHRVKKLGREEQSLDEYLSDDDDHYRTEVERVDSGVGSEIKENVKPNIEVKLRGGPACDECNQAIHEKSEVGSDGALMCEKCAALRLERKEAIHEIVDTEISYGKDLKIIKEEFYLPMKTAGLLNADQIATIFGNVLELITVNERFTDQLQDTLDIACEQGDEDYMTVRLAKLFLEASNMLLVFEQYCVKLTTATSLVEQLEKEKELLKIFLQVSQKDNSALRRMNLKSFLMVPVQRIMRYPLLLNRVYKSTPTDHIDKKPLKDAQTKIEDIIEHINSNAKESSMNNKLRRKMSGSRRYISVGEPNIEFTKMALELLEWNRNDIDTIHVERMHYTQPTDYLWPKKGKSLKFIHVMGILVTLGKGRREEWSEGLLFPRNTGVKEAALILVKEKNGKYIPFRDPILLERCVVSVESEFDEVFEVLDINKESHIFRGDDRRTTGTWYQHLKLQTKNLGQWRRRRNALPNIMIQNLTAKA